MLLYRRQKPRQARRQGGLYRYRNRWLEDDHETSKAITQHPAASMLRGSYPAAEGKRSGAALKSRIRRSFQSVPRPYKAEIMTKGRCFCAGTILASSHLWWWLRAFVVVAAQSDRFAKLGRRFYQ